MNTTKLDLFDTYKKQISEYIEDYHPQLLLDMEEFEESVISRAESAVKVYEDAIKRGENPVEARYVANQVLHCFLEFSPCAYIKEFYEELYHDIIDNDQALIIYKLTKDIFEKYSDDIEGTDEEFELREELKPYMIRFI